jgi:hypothetical protein
MLKISALAAWGQLQIASTRQPYLKDVIRPHRDLLNSLWVGALRDYSLLRTDPDSDSLSTSASGVGMMSSRLGREVLLPVRTFRPSLASSVRHTEQASLSQYYDKASIVILEAVSISMDSRDASIKAAMDDKPLTEFKPTETAAKMPTIRAMPTANFFVVYGLSFELASQSLGNPATSANGATALHAIRNVVDPELCGTQLFDSPLFDELCTLCYRIALSETAILRTEVVRAMRAFAVSRRGTASDEQVRRALAVITFALRAAVPSLEVASTCECSARCDHSGSSKC